MIYTECSPDLCPCGPGCSNQAIQRRQFAPGIQKFLTKERGFGVRTTKPIRAGTDAAKRDFLIYEFSKNHNIETCISVCVSIVEVLLIRAMFSRQKAFETNRILIDIKIILISLKMNAHLKYLLNNNSHRII